jgi:hypothetical protein
LTDQRSGQSCKHQVDRICLLTHANRGCFTANRISRCPKCELILQFRVSEEELYEEFLEDQIITCLE